MKTPTLPRSFWMLNFSQFLGAMNDNAFRWVAVWALVARLSQPGQGINESPIFLSGVIFAIPFIVLSPLAGVLADRFSKRQIIVLCNLTEVVVMVLGLLAFLANVPALIYMVLFLMVTQSTFFGPSKMGILPEMMPREKLPHANGVMSAFVWSSMILGTLLAALLFWLYGDEKAGTSTFSNWHASIWCILFAALGLGLSLFIRDTGVHASDKRASAFFLKDVVHTLQKAWPNRYLFLAILAAAFFLFLGGATQMNIAAYGKVVLEISSAQATFLFLPVAFGMGLGSYLAGRISRRNVEIGLVPLGAAILAVGFLSFGLPWHNLPFRLIVLFWMGIGGGFYIVPINTFLQWASPDSDRGEYIATANCLSFVGLAVASVLLMGLDALGFEPQWRFVFLGGLTVLLTGFVVYVLPDFLVRFIGLVMARIVYRLESEGIENVPIEGGALLVCNHVSYADAILLGATHQRRIRFMVYREYYDKPFFNWILRIMQAIPVSSKDSPRKVVQSLKEARQALDDGYLVCVFGEGSLTRTGYIQGFRRGIEHILKGSDYPIIPVCLHGIWGSILSHSKEHLVTRLPRPFRRRVTVMVGKPMPSDTSAFDVRQEVMRLQSEAYLRHKPFHQPLPVEFTRMARSHWHKFAMADTTGKEVTFGKALIGSLALARALKLRIGHRVNVGVLLPSSVGGALVNAALAFLGRTPVNLNYTASREALEAAVAQAEITHVITSKRFLKKAPCGSEFLPECLYLEEVGAGITGGQKVLALLLAHLAPARWLLKSSPDGKPITLDSTAAIIFSSGSTSLPKGVMLSHYNILSNAESIQQVIAIRNDGCICGVLPFFHAFGFTVTIWLPFLAGIPVVYHYNPLEAETVGELARRYRCSLLVATPTFLQHYTRKIPREHFTALELVITGAEKLKQPVADAFYAKFGIHPMEGYGTTELAPVASVNLPNREAAGVAQQAWKPGSIGRPLPGVTMCVVDPDNLEHDLGYGREGLLLVKGPNVMQGYLKAPDLTRKAFHRGWYVTGDLAHIDHDGFVTITDRLSRFSKIAGEMVPHQAIENALMETLGASEQICAVTAVPDERKGERLVMLVRQADCDAARAYEALKQSQLPNLWIPARKNIFEVEDFPILGSGKMDLKTLRQMAQERVG